MIREDFPPRRATPARPANWFRFLVWAIFGNEDDGPFGDANFKPLFDFKVWRAVAWWFRNPAHNLCFYVWGVADKPRTFYSSRDWGGVLGWTYHVTECEGKHYPFVSFKGRVNFYIGWRPYGAFGLKFNFAK